MTSRRTFLKYTAVGIGAVAVGRKFSAFAADARIAASSFVRFPLAPPLGPDCAAGPAEYTGLLATWIEGAEDGCICCMSSRPCTDWITDCIEPRRGAAAFAKCA